MLPFQLDLSNNDILGEDKVEPEVLEEEDLEALEVHEEFAIESVVVPKNLGPVRPTCETFQAQTDQRMEEIENGEPSKITFLKYSFFSIPFLNFIICGF